MPATIPSSEDPLHQLHLCDDAPACKPAEGVKTDSEKDNSVSDEHVPVTQTKLSQDIRQLCADIHSLKSTGEDSEDVCKDMVSLDMNQQSAMNKQNNENASVATNTSNVDSQLVTTAAGHHHEEGSVTRSSSDTADSSNGNITTAPATTADSSVIEDSTIHQTADLKVDASMDQRPYNGDISSMSSEDEKRIKPKNTRSTRAPPLRQVHYPPIAPHFAGYGAGGRGGFTNRGAGRNHGFISGKYFPETQYRPAVPGWTSRSREQAHTNSPFYCGQPERNGHQNMPWTQGYCPGGWPGITSNDWALRGGLPTRVTGNPRSRLGHLAVRGARKGRGGFACRQSAMGICPPKFAVPRKGRPQANCAATGAGSHPDTLSAESTRGRTSHKGLGKHVTHRHRSAPPDSNKVSALKHSTHRSHESKRPGSSRQRQNPQSHTVPNVTSVTSQSTSDVPTDMAHQPTAAQIPPTHNTPRRGEGTEVTNDSAATHKPGDVQAEQQGDQQTGHVSPPQPEKTSPHKETTPKQTQGTSDCHEFIPKGTQTWQHDRFYTPRPHKKVDAPGQCAQAGRSYCKSEPRIRHWLKSSLSSMSSGSQMSDQSCDEQSVSISLHEPQLLKKIERLVLKAAVSMKNSSRTERRSRRSLAFENETISQHPAGQARLAGDAHRKDERHVDYASDGLAEQEFRKDNYNHVVQNGCHVKDLEDGYLSYNDRSTGIRTPEHKRKDREDFSGRKKKPQHRKSSSGMHSRYDSKDICQDQGGQSRYKTRGSPRNCNFGHQDNELGDQDTINGNDNGHIQGQHLLSILRQNNPSQQRSPGQFRNKVKSTTISDSQQSVPSVFFIPSSSISSPIDTTENPSWIQQYHLDNDDHGNKQLQMYNAARDHAHHQIDMYNGNMTAPQYVLNSQSSSQIPRTPGPSFQTQSPQYNVQCVPMQQVPYHMGISPVHTPFSQDMLTQAYQTGHSPFQSAYTPVQPVGIPAILQAPNTPYPQQNVFQFPPPAHLVAMGQQGQVGTPVVPNMFQYPDTENPQGTMEVVPTEPVPQSNAFEATTPKDRPCGFAGNHPMVRLPPEHSFTDAFVSSGVALNLQPQVNI